MSKFTFINEETTYCTNSKQTLEFSAVSLDDILEEFKYFLKGAGFHFEGDIIIAQETWPVEEANKMLDDYRMSESDDAN
jgi:hypothetical protein